MNNILADKVLMSHYPKITDNAFKLKKKFEEDFPYSKNIRKMV